MILFDTDVVSLILQDNEKVMDRLRQVDEEFAIPIITRIEVLQGRFASVLKAADGAQLRLAMRNLALSEMGLSRFRVIPIDDAAATEFDRLRQNKKLKKIGRADLLIASIALANRTTLVTRNIRHFQLVPGLHIENWAD